MNSIFLFLLTWLGFNLKPTPKFDLHKKQTSEDWDMKIDLWINQNFNIICILAGILVFGVFLFVCFSVCGISAVESGAMRNFMVRGV